VRVYLTGGTGLLGSHVASQLRAAARPVVALCRSGSNARFLSDLGCDVTPGDVRDSPEDLARGMEGCTHLVHAAALVYAGGDWSEVRAVNVEGTENVLRAAALAGVRHVVHLSSVAVYGTVDGPVDEATPLARPLPVRDLYGRSKREAETVARRLERDLALPVTVMRPSAVYGERDRLMIPALARILRSPWVPVFGPGENTLPVVYAGNVAEAIVLAIDAARGGETFDVGLDSPITQRQLFAGLAGGLGRSPRLVPIPATLIRTAVRLLRNLGTGTPGAPHLPLDRVARLALGENPYPSVRIREELAWRPRHDHRDALDRSGRWYAGLN
jgi:nucleoside-diphosphate-sugar epimerase